MKAVVVGGSLPQRDAHDGDHAKCGGGGHMARGRKCGGQHKRRDRSAASQSAADAKAERNMGDEVQGDTADEPESGNKC